MLPAAKEETLASLGSAEEIFSLAAARVEGKTETLSKTRVWGFGEKIQPCIGATWQLSGNPRWGCENSSWKTVVGSALDANGNTLSDPSGKSYSWDFENRLTSVAVPGTGTVNFKYDPFGRRIYKSSPTWTGAFAYDGNNLIETMNSSGTVLADYTQNISSAIIPAIDDLLAMFRAGTASFYQQDGIRSVTSLSSPAATLTDTYTYDAFGNVAASAGTVSNPFKYTGRELDVETGGYYYRTRYYDQSVGRFISEDLIRFKGGTDFYSYVHNRPVTFTDPMGTCLLQLVSSPNAYAESCSLQPDTDHRCACLCQISPDYPGCVKDCKDGCLSSRLNPVEACQCLCNKGRENGTLNSFEAWLCKQMAKSKCK